MLEGMGDRAASSQVEPIRKLGDPVLEQPCREVTLLSEAAPVIRALNATLDHVHTLHDFRRGSGIAAPQIGRSLRIAVVHWRGSRAALINPQIVERSADMFLSREGCLSFFDFRGVVSRHQWVVVTAIDQGGVLISFRAEGDFSALLQHELDHLDGILYIRRLPNGSEDLIRVKDMPYIP